MALVAGCGGDSTDTTGTTASPATTGNTVGDSTTTSGESSGDASEPIKIGFMAPFVGVYADLGQDLENGFKLYLDEIGNKAAGREIILLTEDTQAKPELGPSIATKFIDSEKVDMITGMI